MAVSKKFFLSQHAIRDDLSAIYESHIELLDNLEEDIDLDFGTYILITWNPSDRMVGDDSDYDSKWRNMIGRYLKCFKRCSSEFCFVPEISDMGRLHMHGWFRLKDKIKWVKSVIPLLKRNGRLKVAIMRSKNALYYYRKEFNITSGMLDDFLVICHLNIDDIMTTMQHSFFLKSTEARKNADITALFDLCDDDGEWQDL